MSLRNSVFLFAKYIFSIWLIITSSFILLYILPGDPIIAALGISADMAARKELIHILGFDQPFWQRYLWFLKNIITLNFGYSLYTGEPVFLTAIQRFKVTFTFAVPATISGIVGGYLVAYIAHKHSKTSSSPIVNEKILTKISLIGTSIPFYLLVLFLYWLLQYMLHINNELYYPFFLFILSLYPLCFTAYMFYNFLNKETKQSYILQFKSFGLSWNCIYWKIIIKSALIYLSGTIPIMFNVVFAHCFFIEYVFSLPGACLWIVQAVLNSDYPVIYVSVFLLSFIYLTLKLIIHLFTYKYCKNYEAHITF